MSEPELAEGWAALTLHTRWGRIPVAYFRTVPSNEEPAFWPGCSPPARTFADPAPDPVQKFVDRVLARGVPPAPDDALKAGERVYVDFPHSEGSGPAWSGYGHVLTVHGDGAGILRHPDSDRVAIYYPRVACHREGPHGPPPAEEPTFLGRHGEWDAWWAKYHVHLGGGFASPANIDTSPTLPNPDEYRAALAVARALGLVEAEAEPASTDQILQRMGDRVIDAIGAAHKPEPEPERPEPKFVAGQVVEFGAAHNLHVRRIVGEAEWGQQGGIEQWLYPTETLDGQSGRCGETYQQHPDYDLRPHTMSIADVPNEVKLAIIDGKPVRVVDVPVTEKGTPYSDKLGSAEPDWLQRGKAVTVTGVGDIDEPGAVIEQKDGGCFWPWNVTLAKPGE